MKRTPEEIQRQIDGLEAMKENIPEIGMMGNNHEGIDAQIAILKDEKEVEDFYVSESDAFPEEPDNYIYSLAQDAENWLNKDSDDDLFE
jgi:hypothetical protein